MTSTLSSTIALATQTRAPAAAAASLRNGQCGSWVSGARVQFPGRRSSDRTGLTSCGSSSLSWTRSRGFGASSSLAAKAAFGPVSCSSQMSLASAAFTPEQSQMVKDSWKQLQKLDAGHHALKFFLHVFEIAPSVKRMFSFLKDSSVPLEKNPKLKIHALQVFVMTGQAAAQLGEKGALEAMVPKLVELGQSHVAYGVVDEHFDVVKYALLETLKEALPKSWTPELREAWSLSYDQVVDNIKEEMKLVRARQAAAASEPALAAV